MNQKKPLPVKAPVDPRAYRNAMGTIAKGITILATGRGEELRAMTASAVNSLSLDPLLVLVCLDKKTRFAEALQQEQGFSINILRCSQEYLSNYFAGRWLAETPPDFEFISWWGGPLLDGCAAAVGCEVHEVVEGGDHWIVIGRVVAVHLGLDPVEPLLFYRGGYRELTPQSDVRARDVEDSAAWFFPW